MTHPVKRVVIVGGGTAGWLVAGMLAARFPKRGEQGLDITLIEAPGRPAIGVGEGTWPSIRGTLKQIGVAEGAFLQACEAAFKQGSRFVGWRDGADAYLHPFTLPAIDCDDRLAVAEETTEEPGEFARRICFQAALCEAGRAPKAITTPEYAGAANYAYHLDAGRFGEFLKRHCVEALKVRHLQGEIVRINSDEAGFLTDVLTADGQAIAGDLFVDCSGFSSLLLGGHYGVPFRSCKDVLFVDRAWAVQTPYQAPDAPIGCVTTSTAQPSGWIWDIGLTTRRGVGHVFASDYVSDDEALGQLQTYLRARGDDPEGLSYRRLEIRPGYREAFWRGNCVAVGLSAGFIEPLEASAIALIELSGQALLDLFPRQREDMARAERLFNAAFHERWERIIEFLKLHYVLSRRTDSAFWIDNRAPGSIPDRLADALETWRRRAPGGLDFPLRDEIFPAASYQYILYGMGLKPDPAPWLAGARAKASERLAEVEQAAARLANQLPAHRDLLERIQRFGLQRV